MPNPPLMLHTRGPHGTSRRRKVGPLPRTRAPPSTPPPFPTLLPAPGLAAPRSTVSLSRPASVQPRNPPQCAHRPAPRGGQPPPTDSPVLGPAKAHRRRCRRSPLSDATAQCAPATVWRCTRSHPLHAAALGGTRPPLISPVVRLADRVPPRCRRRRSPRRVTRPRPVDPPRHSLGDA